MRLLPRFVRRNSDVHILCRINGQEILNVTTRQLALIAKYGGRHGVIDVLEPGLAPGQIHSVELWAEYLPRDGKHDPCQLSSERGVEQLGSSTDS